MGTESLSCETRNDYESKVVLHEVILDPFCTGRPALIQRVPQERTDRTHKSVGTCPTTLLIEYVTYSAIESFYWW